jgi:hypothetical protein
MNEGFCSIYHSSQLDIGGCQIALIKVKRKHRKGIWQETNIGSYLHEKSQKKFQGQFLLLLLMKSALFDSFPNF